MFTGIIQELGTLENIKFSGKQAKVFVTCKKIRPKNGDSICVNGACLTVTKSKAGGFTANVVEETLKKTNLGSLSKNALLNLEPSIKANSRFGGHFVTGHIDSTAKFIGAKKSGENLYLNFEITKNLKKFIAKKGSIAINGVSLTVAEVSGKKFAVALIPYTIKNTNLGKLKIGDCANVEIDLIARYLYNFSKKPQ